MFLKNGAVLMNWSSLLDNCVFTGFLVAPGKRGAGDALGVPTVLTLSSNKES